MVKTAILPNYTYLDQSNFLSKIIYNKGILFKNDFVIIRGMCFEIVNVKEINEQQELLILINIMDPLNVNHHTNPVNLDHTIKVGNVYWKSFKKVGKVEFIEDKKLSLFKRFINLFKIK